MANIEHFTQDILQEIMERSIPTTIHKDYALVPLDILEKGRKHLLKVSAKELEFIKKLSFCSRKEEIFDKEK